MGRPRKALISRSATLKAALKIIDEEGLEKLSIRRLGVALNVQGISLYHHFKDKDEILVAVCELALSNVRTPEAGHTEWRDWLLANAIKFHRALRVHPNLIPVLMRRHPLRIGMKEHNATAGLLAVQGVPPEAIMPLLETLEELALGSANYESAADRDEHSDTWKENYPNLYHLSRRVVLSRDEVFELVARATIDAIMNAITHAERRDGSATGARAIGRPAPHAEPEAGAEPATRPARRGRKSQERNGVNSPAP
jgi:AcrR family transcriptional regulator